MSVVALETIEDAVVAKLLATSAVTAITSRISVLLTPISELADRIVSPQIFVETGRIEFREMGSGINSNPDAVLGIIVHCISATRRWDVRRKGESSVKGTLEIVDLVYAALQRVALTVQGSQTCELEAQSVTPGSLAKGIALASIAFSTVYQPEY